MQKKLKNSERENIIWTIFGLGGYGKSTLAKYLLLHYDLPTIIIDPQMQFEDIENSKTFDNPHELWNYIADNEKKFFMNKEILILWTDQLDKQDQMLWKLYNDLLSPLRGRKEILLIVDEIDNFFHNASSDKHPMYKILQFSRNRGFNIVTTLKRPANIHKMLVSLTKRYGFVRCGLDLDLDFIKRNCGQEVMEEVKNLEKLQFCIYDVEKHEYFIDGIKDREKAEFFKYI